MNTAAAGIVGSVYLLSGFAAVAWSESGAPPKGPLAFSERYYKAESFEVPMRDGVMLHTRLLRPQADLGPLPFFMIRTPYGVSSQGYDDPARWRWLAEDGYLFVFQEMRGTGESGGEFVLTPPRTGDPSATDEATDTYDTVEWLLENINGHNAAVGVAGCSYPGYAAVMAALSGHPAVKAVSPQAAMADMFRGDDFYWNGIPLLAQAPFFATTMDWREAVMARPDKADAYEWYLLAGALKDVQPAAFAEPSVTWSAMLENYTYSPFWQSRTLAREAQGIEIPTLHVMGWYDGEDFPGPVRLFQAVDELDRDGLARAIIGPWNHCMWLDPEPGDRLGPLTFGDDTADTFKQLEARFFRHYLRNEGSLDDMPQVLAFETGRGRWREFDSWPEGVPIAKRDLYLAAGQRLRDAPLERAHQDSYLSDPLKPVPYGRRPIGYFTGQDLVPEDGKSRSLFLLEDQRFVHDRPDVLTWISAPLEADLVLSGRAEFVFDASTTGTDIDWIVQLVDVHPDDFDPTLSGYRLPVTRGAVRASVYPDLSRANPLEPNKIERYSILLEPRLHRFEAGHRILLQLQSTYFPYLARNPQKFVPPKTATADDFVRVTNTIHYGKDRPSRLVLPSLVDRQD